LAVGAVGGDAGGPVRAGAANGRSQSDKSASSGEQEDVRETLTAAATTGTTARDDERTTGGNDGARATATPACAERDTDAYLRS
jgi:hypothetical protein